MNFSVRGLGTEVAKMPTMCTLASTSKRVWGEGEGVNAVLKVELGGLLILISL